jgi:hypothetical protein
MKYIATGIREYLIGIGDKGKLTSAIHIETVTTY